MSKSLLPSIDAMSARKNQYFRARRSIVCIYTHADDVSCDSQIMSNDHETDVIINVISSGLWRLLTEGNFKPWFLGFNVALGNWSGALSVMHYRNQMKWNELLNYKLPADIHLRITWKNLANSCAFSLRALTSTTKNLCNLFPFSDKTRELVRENLFNFNSKRTLKSWYCSAYYVNLMRYNNTR